MEFVGVRSHRGLKIILIIVLPERELISWWEGEKKFRTWEWMEILWTCGRIRRLPFSEKRWVHDLADLQVLWFEGDEVRISYDSYCIKDKQSHQLSQCEDTVWKPCQEIKGINWSSLGVGQWLLGKQSRLLGSVKCQFEAEILNMKRDQSAQLCNFL